MRGMLPVLTGEKEECDGAEPYRNRKKTSIEYRHRTQRRSRRLNKLLPRTPIASVMMMSA